MIAKCGFLYFLLLSILLLQNVNGDDDEEEEEEMCPCILLSITEDAVTCSDVENKMYKMQLKMNLEEGCDDEPDMMKMDGYAELLEDADEPLEIWLEATMETEFGQDPVFSCAADLCKSLSDYDAPWWPVVKYFNTTSCPVPQKYYEIKGLLLDLSFANGIMTHDFCGDYNIMIKMKKGIDDVFCIMLGAQIFEAQKKCSECPSKGDS